MPAALIWRNEQILLSKRHKDSHLGGLWEFPGGKFESVEEPRRVSVESLRRNSELPYVTRVSCSRFPEFMKKNWCVFGFMRYLILTVSREGLRAKMSRGFRGSSEGASVSEGE